MAAAGMIGAMSLGSVFTSYAADGWSKSNDSWTYIYNGQTHTGWLQTSEGWYYMDLSTGHMSTGFKQIDGKCKTSGLGVCRHVRSGDGCVHVRYLFLLQGRGHGAAFQALSQAGALGR